MFVIEVFSEGNQNSWLKKYVFYSSNWLTSTRVCCQRWECLTGVWIKSHPYVWPTASSTPSWPGQEGVGSPSPWSPRSTPRVRCPRSKRNSRVRASIVGTPTLLVTESKFIPAETDFKKLKKSWLGLFKSKTNPTKLKSANY